MKSAFYAVADTNVETDPMLDLYAQEEEQAVASEYSYLCTVEQS